MTFTHQMVRLLLVEQIYRALRLIVTNHIIGNRLINYLYNILIKKEFYYAMSNSIIKQDVFVRRNSL